MRTLFVIASMCVAASAVAESEPRVVIGEIAPQGEVPDELPAILATVFANEVDSLGAFDVISQDDVVRVVTLAQNQQLLGCATSKCLTELADLMAADRLASGTLARVGDGYTLTLVLVDLATNEIENRVTTDVQGSRSALVAEVRRQARFLMQKSLAARSGKLVLAVDQMGAEVKVDEKLMGITPVGLLDLPGGFHAVRVTKEGFVDFSRDVEIGQDETFDLRATLVPSPDFARDYESTANLYRGLAWGTFGGAAVTGIVAVVLKSLADSSAEGLRTDVGNVLAGAEVSGMTSSADFQTRKDGVDALDSAALGLTITAALSAIASTYFFLAGDEPGKYEAFVE